MVRKYIRKLREKAAKAERPTNMVSTANKKGRGEKTMAIKGNLDTVSSTIADTIAVSARTSTPSVDIFQVSKI